VVLVGSNNAVDVEATILAHGGPAGSGDVGSESQPVSFELRVQFIEHDARFDAGPPLLDVQFEDMIEIFRRVDDEAGANRLPRLRRPSAAHRHRTAMLRTSADDADQIVPRARKDDPPGLNLVDAGVSGIERA
jgi:hypothetical protein